MLKMIVKICLYLTIICKIATANWTISDEGQCFYTIITTQPSNTTIKMISTCDSVEPYITFIIANSTNKHVTTNFFNTNFCPWVRLLKAIDNKWTNIHSYTFNKFKNVLYIDLSGNCIKNINMAFDGLNMLDSLNLSRNEIEIIRPETFITSDKTRLSLLDLSYNLLTHLSENLFTKVSNLRILFLQGNQISIFNEKSITPLRNLIYLNLSDNILTKFNFTLSNVTSLIGIDLQSVNI